MDADQVASAPIVAGEFGSPATYTPLSSGIPLDLDAVMTYGAEVVIGEVYERRDIAHIQRTLISDPSKGDSLLVDSVDSYLVDSWSRSGDLWQLVLLKQ